MFQVVFMCFSPYFGIGCGGALYVKLTCEPKAYTHWVCKTKDHHNALGM